MADKCNACNRPFRSKKAKAPKVWPADEVYYAQYAQKISAFMYYYGVPYKPDFELCGPVTCRGCGHRTSGGMAYGLCFERCWEKHSRCAWCNTAQPANRLTDGKCEDCRKEISEKSSAWASANAQMVPYKAA